MRKDDGNGTHRMTRTLIDARLIKELEGYLETQKRWAIDYLRECIAFPSVSGNEARIMKHLEGFLRTVNGDTETLAIPETLRADPDFVSTASDHPYSARPNLIHVKRGRKGGKSLIVCGHSDVVPAADEGAFGARLVDGVLYGRGACDDKGPLVAWLLALKALDHFDVKLPGDLETHIVIEEEVGGNGALSLIASGRRADGVIVLEATDLNIHPACRGALWFRIDIEGRSVHMASIQNGVNAAQEAIKVIHSLERYESRLIADSMGQPMFTCYERPTMVNIGIFQSGDWPSTVPGSATVEGGVGFLPNRTLETVRREIREVILEGTGEWVRDHHVVSFDRLHNDAYQIDPEHALVHAMKASCAHADFASAVHGMSASCDARLYYHRGKMPVIVFGPGSIQDAHSREEKVGIPDILKAAKALFCMASLWGDWSE